MSRNGKDGHRQTEAQSVLAAVGIVLALLIASFLAYSQGVYSERRNTAPHNHAESAKASASRRCVGLEPVAMFECVNEEVERSEETARAEQDLDAQQNMALWALFMVILGTATTVIGTVGTLYLVRTFRENRRSADAARRSADAARDANRPWLWGRVIPELPLIIAGDKALFTVKVELQNLGNAPAILKSGIDVEGFICVRPITPLCAAQEALKKISQLFYMSPPYRGKTVFGGHPYVQAFEWEEEIVAAPTPYGIPEEVPEGWPFTEDDLVAFVAVGVWYDFPGGEGRTEFVYEFRPSRGPIKRETGPVDPYSLERLDHLDRAE